uniref:Uncharacterized protein n=1 Tax=Arundo donax TaxID=35708 RepID=A0A0A9GFD8_ARUDO
MLPQPRSCAVAPDWCIDAEDHAPGECYDAPHALPRQP